MTVNSMTGFARASGKYLNAENNEITWNIELRSVNGKGLDIRVRLPASLDALEQDIKKLVSSAFARGNLSLNISLKKQGNTSSITLNEQQFREILKAAKEASTLSALPMPNLDSLLSMRHVLQESEIEENEDEQNALKTEILKTITSAIEDLKTARSQEGTKLATSIKERLTIIQSLIDKIQHEIKQQPQQLKERLKENIKKLLDQADEFNEERLHQEAMLLAVKADVSEELDRLIAHVEQANSLLESGDPIGRRLDFLCQEFNREANTLCSKSHSKTLTYIGLDLKTVIDQMREQVQNIE